MEQTDDFDYAAVGSNLLDTLELFTYAALEDVGKTIGVEPIPYESVEAEMTYAVLAHQMKVKTTKSRAKKPADAKPDKKYASRFIVGANLKYALAFIFEQYAMETADEHGDFVELVNTANNLYKAYNIPSDWTLAKAIDLGSTTTVHYQNLTQLTNTGSAVYVSDFLGMMKYIALIFASHALQKTASRIDLNFVIAAVGTNKTRKFITAEVLDLLPAKPERSTKPKTPKTPKTPKGSKSSVKAVDGLEQQADTINKINAELAQPNVVIESVTF